jgi:hypothetical protein
MLGALKECEKLLPISIFKGKNNCLEHIKCVPGTHYEKWFTRADGIWCTGLDMDAWNLKTCMDQEILEASNLLQIFSYLGLAKRHSHLRVKVKATSASCNTELVLISVGYTTRSVAYNQWI